MAAHTRPIPIRHCKVCLSKATVEVFNTYNASYGFYCQKHGLWKVTSLNEEMKEPKHNLADSGGAV